MPCPKCNNDIEFLSLSIHSYQKGYLADKNGVSIATEMPLVVDNYGDIEDHDISVATCPECGQDLTDQVEFI